jgi:hypothetical protein
MIVMGRQVIGRDTAFSHFAPGEQHDNTPPASGVFLFGLL